MHAIDRLSARLRVADETLSERQAHVVACYIYNDYLPSQLLGMKEAAERIGLLHRDTGLPNSNSLTMRLSRGADIDLLVKIAGQRVTTKDAIDAYAEMHPPVKPTRDDDSHKEAS